MPAEEVWKDIQGYPNYQVSNLGRVKRFEKVMKGSFVKRQGFVVFLKKSDGRVGNVRVSRLMLTAFVRPPKDGEVARHLDDNKRNQALSNLAWGTQRDNVHDSIKNGLAHKGTDCSWSKLSENQISEIKNTKEKQKDLANKYGVNQSTISRIISGDRWAHMQ